MLVHIKCGFTILGKIISNSQKHRLQFSVSNQGKPTVQVDVIPDENSVESFCDIDISKETEGILKTDKTGTTLLEEAEKELSVATSLITEATRRVLTTIKYCLKQRDIDEALFSAKPTYWSLDKVNWKRMPRKLYVAVDIEECLPLNENSAADIQDYLERGPDPFLALKFLHRAQRERNSRYKWIDATIAAELAIKEALIILDPDIETLLMEVPSPPLHKLYGPVLEHYTNERSPKVSKLSEGAEVRNKLIHRPQGAPIPHQKAIEYVKDVEAAIGHLFSLLYPEYYSRHYFVDHHRTVTR